jgi:hypothetical protein
MFKVQVDELTEIVILEGDEMQRFGRTTRRSSKAFRHPTNKQIFPLRLLCRLCTHPSVEGSNRN